MPKAIAKTISEEKAKKEILESVWSVKAVKFMKGHDADSMECSLYKDGKRVASVWDDSYGGGFQYTWLKTNLTDEFEGFAKTMVVDSEYSKDGLRYSGDCVIDVLVNDFEETKQYKRLCKTKAVYIAKDPKTGKEDVWSFPAKYTEKHKEVITRKIGSDLVEIINERFI